MEVSVAGSVMWRNGMGHDWQYLYWYYCLYSWTHYLLWNEESSGVDRSSKSKWIGDFLRLVKRAKIG